MAVRKVNIVDWDSPAVKRYLSDVATLPYVMLFNRSGKRVGELGSDKIDQLEGVMKLLLEGQMD